MSDNPRHGQVLVSTVSLLGAFMFLQQRPCFMEASLQVGRFQGFLEIAFFIAFELVDRAGRFLARVGRVEIRQRPGIAALGGQREPAPPEFMVLAGSWWWCWRWV
jgi:hypothetical protein